MVMLLDRAPLERVRKLADGRIAAIARFARSDVYTYIGTEVGMPDLQKVNVYRPESEVFDQAAMASFGHKAITIGHPSEAVSAGNWKGHSIGCAPDRCQQCRMRGREAVIKTATRHLPVKLATASRGKIVRAEPIAVLYEQGKVSHCGEFEKMEEQLCAMTSAGFVGQGSPDPADALV